MPLNSWHGTQEFWRLYDSFCQEPEIERHVSEGNTPLAQELRVITRNAALARNLSALCRPARGWQRHYAWVALGATTVFNHDGVLVTTVRPGDVMIVQWDWDREILVTHSPHREMITGSLRGCLNKRGEYGLFLPLFERVTIESFIDKRTALDVKQAAAFVKKEAHERRWLY